MMQTKSRPGLGLFLAIITAIAWGTLPIAMRELIPTMEPVTIIFYRFVISSVILFLILFARHQLPARKLLLTGSLPLLFILGTIGLSGNFVLFASALRYVSPPTLQVIIQVSTIGLMLSSIWIFKETLHISQIIGMLVLFVGLLLFFNVNLVQLVTQLTDYSLGVYLGLLAALIWVIYGLVQKALLKTFHAQQILLVIYILCVCFLAPFAHIKQIQALNTIELMILFYCGFNTIIGYGALAEAMNCWQVSQVSAVITLTPLFTLIFSDMLAIFWPDYFTMPAINLIGYIGAIAVVLGAMITAIGPRLAVRRRRSPDCIEQK